MHWREDPTTSRKFLSAVVLQKQQFSLKVQQQQWWRLLHNTA